MIRSTVFSIGVALGIGSAASAQVYFPQVPAGRGYVAPYPVYASPVVARPHIHRTYEVEFRARSCDRWRVYAVTANHDYAHRMARSLRHQGYQARVDH